MNDRLKLKRLILCCATIALIAIVASTAFGQCSMCRASLAGSTNTAFIRNFNLGVLVLLLPPVSIFCGIFVVLRRHNKNNGQVTDDGNADENV